jgi:DNA-binding NtrC family response regulator
LAGAVKSGSFREDLYYRLNVVEILVPPLRERPEDIRPLVQYFLEQANCKNHRQVKGISEDALEALERQPWPGNVRELKNLVERMIVLKGTGTIARRDLPINPAGGLRAAEAPAAIEISEEGICLNSAVTEFEKALILQSLEKTKWVKNKAAKLLHLNRTTLVEKIKRHQLRPSGAVENEDE